MEHKYYLGLDLSTQQLKGIVIDENLKQITLEKVDFDADLPAYKTVKGVYANGKEVQAPVAMWLEALDLLFTKLTRVVNLGNLYGVSGACQQHGSVYWNTKAQGVLADLTESQSLKDQLSPALAWDLSPNWQDHSTEQECRQFEAAVGGPDNLAEITGSKAHHRFTGPQILKVKHKMSQVYDATDRVALVSSFLASVLAGQYVDIEVSDACGMNLWDIANRQLHPQLLELFGDKSEISRRIGPINQESTAVSKVSAYFVQKYGVNADCEVVPFTGDNPGTILSLPLQANDVIVSLGTSTTALVVTNNYVPSPLYHLFAHPVGAGSYMGMLCYCNGALAREKVRDAVNGDNGGDWSRFNFIAQQAMENGQILGGSGSGSDSEGDLKRIGFFFPLAEIIPSVDACQHRLTWRGDTVTHDDWPPDADVLGILESQALSIRYRLTPLLTSPDRHPRRVYYVGGASANATICAALTRVLVPSGGAFRVADMSDACAFGAAAKAAHAAVGGGWEEFIAQRTNSSTFASVTVPKGSRDRVVDSYSEAVDLFVRSEAQCFNSD